MVKVRWSEWVGGRGRVRLSLMWLRGQPSVNNRLGWVDAGSSPRAICRPPWRLIRPGKGASLTGYILMPRSEWVSAGFIACTPLWDLCCGAWTPRMCALKVAGKALRWTLSLQCGTCQASAEISVSSAVVSHCLARKCSWPFFQALFFTHQVSGRN